MNNLQRKYRQQQLALDKIRGKKLMNSRRRFKWKKIHTKSLPELKRAIRQDVKNFQPDVNKEIDKLNNLLKDGVLTQEEFEKAKKKLLDD